MELNDITRKMIEEAAGKSAEEIIELVKEKGLELTDEQLEQVSGGEVWDPPNVFSDGCPKCGSMDISFSNVGQIMYYTCRSCGHKWC